MPKYMFSGSYTKKGVAGLLNEGGSARRDEAEKIAKSLGGSLEAYYWCYGETDFMCIMDIPESAKAAKLALTVGASGTFNGKLTPLITVDEMMRFATQILESSLCQANSAPTSTNTNIVPITQDTY